MMNTPSPQQQNQQQQQQQQQQQLQQQQRQKLMQLPQHPQQLLAQQQLRQSAMQGLGQVRFMLGINFFAFQIDLEVTEIYTLIICIFCVQKAKDVYAIF